MRHRALAGLVLTYCTVAAFARGNIKELLVPLRFAPQEGVHSSNPDLLPAVLSTAVAIRVEDARKLDDALLIGHGTGGDDKSFPIRADRNPAEYLQEVFVRIAKDWGLRLEAPVSRTLIVKITRIDLDESNKAVGSMYGAEVKLAYMLENESGAVLVEGANSGTAHRYGRAHSAENCNEVLSDALKEAFASIADDHGLQAAWASGKQAPAVGSPAAETTESRLRKLDDLLNKGLITKSEYDKKRSEILKDM